MKRSEMIALMIEEMFRWQDQDSKFQGGWKHCMSCILDKMEEAGMLPPGHSREYCGNDRYEYSYTWEDEK